MRPADTKHKRRADAREEASGLFGWKVRVVFGAEQTSGGFAMIEVRGARGASMPLHVHHNEDECLYVLEGGIRVIADGEETTVAAGETVTLPREGEHAFVVDSEEARVLVLLSPAGMESLVSETLKPVAEPLAQPVSRTYDMERLVGMAARYGLDITGAPPPGRESRV